MGLWTALLRPSITEGHIQLDPQVNCKLFAQTNVLQLLEVGCPEARDLSGEIISTTADRQWVQLYFVLTGSHPGAAENPGVPQPGFDPEVMSLKPSP